MHPASQFWQEREAKTRGLFATTHWSMVRRAAGNSTSPEAAAAREELCRTYWYPIYAHLRRLGHSPANAQDLTQEFFARMLGPRGFALARCECGRFRSYTLGALKHFLADASDRRRAQKRGGGEAPLSWEQDRAEIRLAHEPVNTESPDRLFERRWAITILDRALACLGEEEGIAGRAEAFGVLQHHLTGFNESTYAGTAARLGLSESAVKSAIHRLRRRYRAVLREEVAKTVTGPEEVDGEIRHLLAILASHPCHG